MPANAVVTTRIDETIKQEAGAVLEQMGLSVSDAVRMMLTKIARERTFPFELRTPNQETIEAMEEARSGNLKRFDSIEALMDDLHADD